MEFLSAYVVEVFNTEMKGFIVGAILGFLVGLFFSMALTYGIYRIFIKTRFRELEKDKQELKEDKQELKREISYLKSKISALKYKA